MKSKTRLLLIILVILGALATKTAFGKGSNPGEDKDKIDFSTRRYRVQIF